MSTPRTEIEDTFNGDNEHLRSSIKALINLSDDGALVPHGLGGHARELLASSYHHISQLERELKEARKMHADRANERDHALRDRWKWESELEDAKSALVKAREEIIWMVDHCQWCGGSGRDNDGEAELNEPCPRCTRFGEALTAIDEVLK